MGRGWGVFEGERTMGRRGGVGNIGVWELDLGDGDYGWGGGFWEGCSGDMIYNCMKTCD